MTLNDVLIAQLQQSLQLLQWTVADLSDADLLTRPVPNANHPNWQLGHLINSETNMLTDAGIQVPPIPADIAAKYKKETATDDAPSHFLTKDQLLALLQSTRNATIAWTKSATAEQLASPAPEKFRSFAATLADLIAILPSHDGMHLGQIQVVRRKLNKPLLF